MNKKYLLIIITIITLTIITGCNQKEKSPKEPKPTKQDIIENILTYDLQSDYINEDFLNWVYDNYQEKTLTKVQTQLKENTYNQTTWHDLTGSSLQVLYDLYQDNYENNSWVQVIDTKKDSYTISFVGDISLADNFEIMPYYDSRKQKVYGILSESVVNTMTSSDIMVANNEFTFSNRGTPIPNKYYTFRGDPSRVSIYHEMGVDLVSLANNHAYDFGEDAFLDTLDTLDEAGIKRVGGGRNIDEATQPFYYIIGGYKVAFISSTRAEKFILTPEATSNSSGVFRCYDPTLLKETIKKAKQNSDYVILLIHWGKEDSHELETVQIDTSKDYIDAGADLIVGAHAHVLQGMEYYHNKLIAYNLGDFIFNRETKPTGILQMTINNDGRLTYQFKPCMQDNFYTDYAIDSKHTEIIANLNTWSRNATIDEDGNINTVN